MVPPARRPWLRAWILAAGAAFLVAIPTALAQDPTAIALERRLQTLARDGSIEIAGETVHGSDALSALYRSGGTPLWTGTSSIDAFVRAVEGVHADGLDPLDYHLQAIESLRRDATGPGERADLDLLLSSGLLRVVHDLQFGKVDSEDPAAGRGLSRLLTPTDRVSRIVGWIAAGEVESELGSTRPNHFIYRGLVDALAELRAIEAAGGWESIPAGPTLRPGDTHPSVSILRRRLATQPIGSMPGGVRQEDFYDPILETEVRAFQHRHGLNEDGLVGPATRAELNVPVRDRIDQIRINLERARWVTHDLPTTFVAVNIAGARVYFVREGDVVFETRSIVGRTSTRTPVFRATMRYIDLNPTWTVPPGIVGEILEDVRTIPRYLERIGMNVIDRDGRTVRIPAEEIGAYSARTFPYYFRQEPGPLNPLGQIKFVFPNRYNVYLHDTPSRSLFEREERLFSHGCIRVQNPLALAELILDDPHRWSRADLEAAIATGRTRTIGLSQPLPVLVLYWTASTDLHGELHFYRDVYGRDPAVLRALNRVN